MKCKKTLSVCILVFVLLVSMTACGNSGSKETVSSEQQTTARQTEEKPADSLELPIVTEPLTLTYWVPLANNVAATMKSYNEIAAYKEFEKKTGIHIEFIHVSTSASLDAFNLMIASGNLPDLIETTWTVLPGGPAKYLKDKNIIPLNDLVNQYAPNLKKALDENSDWNKMARTDDGILYSFPLIRGDEYLLTSAGPVMRKDWLDKLNLPEPVTFDDWHTILKAFKENDPNGNGKADEIPFTLNYVGLSNYSFTVCHLFAGAYGITANDYYQEDGVVKYGPIQPGYKEVLKLFNSWYKEGLIDSDYAATDGNLFAAKVTGDLLGSFSAAVGGGIGGYMDMMAEKNPEFNLIGVKLPVLKAGDTAAIGNYSNPISGGGVAITSANKHLEESAKWLDYKYSPEGSMIANFGIEGESYTMVDGYPRYTEAVLKNPNGYPLAQSLARNCLAGFSSGGYIQDKRYMEQYAVRDTQKQALEKWTQPANKIVLPPITLTPDESSNYAVIYNDINTYVNEMFDKFVMGAEPIDNFEKYVQTIKSMKIDDAVRMQQAALDRYNNRK